jgi:hypothetical protein
MTWKYFGSACVVAAWIMNALGAPLLAILAGISLAITWKIYNSRERRQL